MATNKPFSIHRILQTSGSELSEMVQRSSHLARLSSKLASHLGEPLGEHVHIANINQHTVVLMTDSSAWSTRLRYQIPNVINFLAQALPDSPPRDARVITRPNETRPTPGPLGVRPDLSTQSAELLRSLASGYSGQDQTDIALQDALLRLARHADRNKSDT